MNTSIELFRKAVLAAEGCEEFEFSEVVESHEPMSNFRPVDVMSEKAAGAESQTEFGLVVKRKGVQRGKGNPRETMFLMRDESRDITLIGWA